MKRRIIDQPDKVLTIGRYARVNLCSVCNSEAGKLLHALANYDADPSFVPSDIPAYQWRALRDEADRIREWRKAHCWHPAPEGATE